MRYIRRKNKPTVAILTTFYEVMSGFSVVTCVTNQIHQLLDHGYVPRVLVQRGMPTSDPNGTEFLIPFPEVPETDRGPHRVWNHHKIDLRPVVPPLHLKNGIADDFEQRVDRIEAALYEHLEGVDVCITHDIMLLDTYHEHNVAVRRVAHRLPNILWLHWLHSCPRGEIPLQYPLMARGVVPPGYLVYPNASDISHVQRVYRLVEQPWRAKPCRAAHGLNLMDRWHFSPVTKRIVNESGLLDADVGIVYPARMGGSKQFHKIIFMLAGIKDTGYTGRLVGVDWQSTGGEFLEYKQWCLELADRLGVREWVYFTSELGDDLAAGVDPDVVAELFYCANVFLCPSVVETLGLTAIEASAIGGNLLGLNYDLRVHLEMFEDHGLYFDFGSLDRKRRWHEEEDEARFWKGEARTLVAELRHNNRALWARTQMRKAWALGALWPEFEPLLYLEPLPGHDGPWWPNVTVRESARAEV